MFLLIASLLIDAGTGTRSHAVNSSHLSGSESSSPFVDEIACRDFDCDQWVADLEDEYEKLKRKYEQQKAEVHRRLTSRQRLLKSSSNSRKSGQSWYWTGFQVCLLARPSRPLSPPCMSSTLHLIHLAMK